MTREVVRSIKNSVVQRARAALAGRVDGVCVLEGERLIGDARSSGLELEALLVSDDRDALAEELERAGSPIVRVTADVLGRVSRLTTSPGVMALAKTPGSVPLDELTSEANALVLVACGLQNPGNLGALARSAEAAGATGIAVLPGGVSPWNEKALRGSMGSLLRLPLHFAMDAAELAEAFEQRGVRCVACTTRGGTTLGAFDFGGRIAFWLGAETGELPHVANGFECISIPMRGGVESLNATVAGSLVLFAAGRAEEGS